MKRCIVHTLFFFGTVTGFAQTDSDSIEVKYYLNPIVKTATKIDGAQRDLAASISLIDRRQIEVSSTHAVLEMIQKHIPSLYVTEWGVMGFGVAGQSAGKISIRGAGGSANTQVLILRNGRPDFMGLMGCTIADEFSSDGVERIEIIRGPGSFLYGTNASGGVINIVSKRHEGNGFRTSMAFGLGSFGTRKFNLSHGGRLGKLKYFITANSRQTDGHRDFSDYEGRHYTAHLGLDLTSNTTAELNINLADLMLHDPGLINTEPLDRWYDIVRWGGDLSINHHSRFGDTNMKIHANFGEHDFFTGWHSDDRTTGFMIHHSMKLWHGLSATLGFDYKRYGGMAKDQTSDYGEYFITETAPYLHLQQMLFKRYILSAGIRQERHELFGTELLPKLGVVVHVNPKTVLRISASKGFRSPSIRELYFWAPANDRLTPDRLWNYELGYIQELGSVVSFEAALFESQGSNLIQFSVPPPLWVNSGQYSHRGYELMLRGHPTHRFHCDLTWSHIQLSDDVFNIPEKKLTASVQYQFKGISLVGNLIMIKDLTGADFSQSSAVPVLHSMEDYTVVDFSTRLKVIPQITLKLALKNALDARYQSMYGYPMPGRHFHADVSYTF